MAINDMVYQVMDKIAIQAALLCELRRTQTLMSREIETAVQLVLPTGLAMHAITFGREALERYREHPPSKRSAGARPGVPPGAAAGQP
jgi:hypothetical protein